MSFFEKARTFFEASGMVSLDFLACGGRPPAEAALGLADVEVSGRYRVTAQGEPVGDRGAAVVAWMASGCRCTGFTPAGASRGR